MDGEFEDGQVVDFHCVSLEQLLSYALHEVGDKPLDGSGREGRIVLMQMSRQVAYVERLPLHGAHILFHFLVDGPVGIAVPVKFNHNPMFLGDTSVRGSAFPAAA